MSISGTGVHILMFGKKPGSDVCRVSLKSGVEVEMYDSGRYFTVSGNVLQGSPDLIKNDGALSALYNAILKKREERLLSVVSCQGQGGAGERVKPSEDDWQLWQKMFRSRHGARIKALFDGDISEYGGDDSRADLAMCNHLAYWTNGDEGRMAQMFLETGLNRPKWARNDYRDRTIRQALKGFRPYHDYTAAERKEYAQRKEAEEEAAWKAGRR